MSEEVTFEPPSKKQKTEDQTPQHDLLYVDDFSKDVDMDGEDRGLSVSRDNYSNFVTQEELERLREFQVLDEVKSNDEDSNGEDSESSDGKSEGLPEEEIEKMLEEDLPEDFKGVPKPKEKPYITRQKIVLEEKGVNHFEVLPLDWMMARHHSGMPIYMHRATRVCTLSKPYFLGKGNARRHDIPISAIPCLAYRKALEEEKKQKEIDKQIEELIKSGTWKQNVDKENTDKTSENNENSVINLGDKVKSDSKDTSDISDGNAFQCPFSGKTATDKIAKESIDINSKCPFKRGFLTKDSETENNKATRNIKNDDSSIISEDMPKIAQDKTNSNKVLEEENKNSSPKYKTTNDGHTTEKVDTKFDYGNSEKIKEVSVNEIKSSTGCIISKNIQTNTTNQIKSTKTDPTLDEACIDTSCKNETNNEVIFNHAGITDQTKSTTDDASAEETTDSTSNPDANTEVKLNNESEILLGGDTSNQLEALTDTVEAKDTANNTETNEAVPLNRQPVVLPGGIVMPPPRVETVSTSWKTQHLTPELVNEYCKSLFKFKTVNIMHFKRWADRRKYTKARKTLQYPTLPEGTKLITIPAQPSNGQENGGKSAKRDWVMNMNGRSYLSVFHEYVRRALQKQPVYEFKQLENASTPYQATVYIGGMQYGVGRGSSKRAAKSAAARASIHILIPEMRHELDDKPEGDDQSEPDFSFFDYVGIEDPRITEFCASTCEPSPYAILRTCLLRNFGMSDRHINTEMKKLEYQKIELTMKVGKHSATVVCKNKKTAKQRASQAILQALHPHVRSWGSLLRLYGSRSVKSCKEKKLEEQQITLLQDAAKRNEPNYAVLEKLRNEMKKLRERDVAVVPIGTLLVRDDLPTHSGSNLNNVDL